MRIFGKYYNHKGNGIVEEEEKLKKLSTRTYFSFQFAMYKTVIHVKSKRNVTYDEYTMCGGLDCAKIGINSFEC